VNELAMFRADDRDLEREREEYWDQHHPDAREQRRMAVHGRSLDDESSPPGGGVGGREKSPAATSPNDRVQTNPSVAPAQGPPPGSGRGTAGRRKDAA
jgi:hypothetical protein